MINEKTDEIHNTCSFNHFEIYREICHYKINPKKAVLKHFRAHCRLVAHPPFHHLAYRVRPAVKAKRSGAGIGSLANSVTRAPDDLTTARSRSCWCVCTRVKKATFVAMAGAEECARLQTDVPINTRDGLASSSRRKATQPGWRGGRIQRRAPHHRTAKHTSHFTHISRTTSTTSNLRLLRGPGAAAFPSCTPHYRCKPSA